MQRNPGASWLCTCLYTGNLQKAASFSAAFRLKADPPFHNSLAYNGVHKRRPLPAAAFRYIPTGGSVCALAFAADKACSDRTLMSGSVASTEQQIVDDCSLTAVVR